MRYFTFFNWKYIRVILNLFLHTISLELINLNNRKSLNIFCALFLKEQSMATILLSQTIDTQQVLGNFRDFLVSNGVLTMASGIIIGISTTLFIKSLVSDMVLPLLYILLFGWVKFISPGTSKIIKGGFLNTEFRWQHTIQNIITWLVIIFVAFLILEYLVRRSFLRKFYEAEEKVTEEDKPIFKMVNIPNIPELAVRNIRNDMVDRSSMYVMQHYR